MNSYLAQIKRQILKWLQAQKVWAIAVVKRTSRSVSYVLANGKRGACFVPNLVIAGLSNYEIPTYETFRYSNRIAFMVKNLKTVGKNDRTSVICNLYIGMHDKGDAIDLGGLLGCKTKFDRLVRDPQRIKGYRNELVLRGDWNIASFPAIANLIDKLERRPLV